MGLQHMRSDITDAVAPAVNLKDLDLVALPLLFRLLCRTMVLRRSHKLVRATRALAWHHHVAEAS